MLYKLNNVIQRFLCHRQTDLLRPVSTSSGPISRLERTIFSIWINKFFWSSKKSSSQKSKFSSIIFLKTSNRSMIPEWLFKFSIFSHDRLLLWHFLTLFKFSEISIKLDLIWSLLYFSKRGGAKREIFDVSRFISQEFSRFVTRHFFKISFFYNLFIKINIENWLVKVIKTTVKNDKN